MTTDVTSLPPRATIRWVAENLLVDGLTQEHAPTAGCWSLLTWVRTGGPEALHTFYTLHFPRLIPVATDSDPTGTHSDVLPTDDELREEIDQVRLAVAADLGLAIPKRYEGPMTGEYSRPG